MLAAEVGVVAADVDDGRPLAHGALHVAPPEMTGRISTTSPSSRSASPGTSVSPRITEHRLAVELEPLEQGVDADRPRHLDLALGVAQADLHVGPQPRGWSVWVMSRDSPGCSSSRKATMSRSARCWYSRSRKAAKRDGGPVRGGRRCGDGAGPAARGRAAASDAADLDHRRALPALAPPSQERDGDHADDHDGAHGQQRGGGGLAWSRSTPPCSSRILASSWPRVTGSVGCGLRSCAWSLPLGDPQHGEPDEDQADGDRR